MHGGAFGKAGALYCLFHPIAGIQVHSARWSERSQHKVCFWEYNEATSIPALCYSSVGNVAVWIQGRLCMIVSADECILSFLKIFCFPLDLVNHYTGRCFSDTCILRKELIFCSCFQFANTWYICPGAYY